jgi:hypothetical protein
MVVPPLAGALLSEKGDVPIPPPRKQAWTGYAEHQGEIDRRPRSLHSSKNKSGERGCVSAPSRPGLGAFTQPRRVKLMSSPRGRGGLHTFAPHPCQRQAIGKVVPPLARRSRESRLQPAFESSPRKQSKVFTNT